jgi:NAD-dependent deacetylase
VTPEGLARAAEILARAERVVVSSGAGMSRESGIPTFRDAMEGLWASFDPQELATEEGFRRDPRHVWSWYAWRRQRIAQARPNPGHHAVAQMETVIPSLTVVTQNVDGLHADAGSADVVEVHGSIRRVKCLDRGHLFSGELPAAAVERAWSLAGRCDAMLLIGTSGTVWPAAELPLVARRAGARIIEVNPAPSELTHAADVFLQGPAGQVLPALVDEIRRRKDGQGAETR